jgi:hypothetical protein
MSALVATTLDLAQKSVAKPNIVAAIAKLVFLRMGASDFRAAGDQRLSQNEGYGTLEKAVVI